MTKRRRRVRRWLVVIGLTITLLLGGAVTFLRLRFNGTALAGTIEGFLDEQMSGRIEVQSIDWETSQLPKVVTGGWIPFTMKNVNLWDPQGLQILHIDKITCQLDIHALLFDRHDFVFRHVVLDGGWAVLEEIREPLKLHAYDFTVFSLIASFYGKRKPGFEVGISASSPPVFDIRDFELRNIDITLKLALEGRTREDAEPDPVEERRHGLVAELEDVNGKGFFYTDPHDPLIPKLYFSIGGDTTPLTAAHAKVTLLGEYPLEFDRFALTRFAQLPWSETKGGWPDDPIANNLELDLTGHAVDGAEVHLFGAMQDYWDSVYGGTYDITAKLEHAGKLARTFDSAMGGADPEHDKDLSILSHVTGPVLFPKIDATMTNLKYSVELTEDEPPLELFLDQATVGLDLATEQGYLEEVVAHAEQNGPRGEVRVSANFGISPYYADATLDITQPIDLKPWLPEAVTDSIGSKISGHLHATGDAEYTLQVDDLDLHLGRVHLDRGTIYAIDEMETIRLVGLHGRAGQTDFTIGGKVQPTPQSFDLDITLDSRDLDAWLKDADLPEFAQTVRSQGAIHASGTIENPTAEGTVRFGGVTVIDDLETEFTYADSLVTIVHGVSRSLGLIRANGAIDVDGTPRAVDIHVTGDRIDLARIPGAAGLATGKADLDVRVDGPLGGNLDIDATLTSDDVTLLGQKATRLRACYNHDPSSTICKEAVVLDDAAAAACRDDARRGGRCIIAGVTRVDGGAAHVMARTDTRGRLAGNALIEELPLDAIAQLAGTGELPAGGTARLKVDLSGTLAAPTADGSLDVVRTWLLDAYLGDQRFKLRAAATDDPGVECAMGAAAPPEPPRGATGKLAVCGSMYDGRVVIGAVIATSGKLRTRARVDVLRVELDPFVDLAKLVGAPSPVRAWATGTITAETELLGEDPPELQLELSELALLLERVDSDGRPAPLVISAATPLSLHFDGTTATLGRPVTLSTPAGKLTLDGSATQEKLVLAVSGSLDVHELEPVLATWLDEAAGRIEIAGTIKGTITEPEIDATLELWEVALRPARQDAVLSIEHAKIELDPVKGLVFGDLSIAVDDSSSGEHAVLNAKGGIALDGLTPTRWGVIVHGELAGKMLLALAPQQLSQASGVAILDLDIQGDGMHPSISGDLTFDPTRPFSIMPRGLRRDIILTDGKVEFTDEQITLDDVSGSLDDEGRFSRVRGQIDLVDFAPVGGDVTLSADGIPFRVPRTLDLVISADDLRLIWGDDDDGDGEPDMSIEGGVEIVQGRFVKDFSFGELVLQPSDPGGGASVPFWEAYPMLGRAQLDLAIHAGSLSVVNKIANIELAGEVRLTGTPRTPELEGEIQVQRGTFKPQFTRARFTRTRGSVTFSHFSRFPTETPLLDIQSEADYRDSTGQDHLISLSLQGPLSRLTWDLSTSSGLNKSQTIALIISGKAPADVLRNANDPLGADPNLIDPSTDPTDGAADQLLKDVAGDFISLLVADPLKDIEILDVARVEVGTGSIGFHGERKVATNANVVGDVEQTVRGRTINVRMEIKWTNGLTLQLGWLSKKFDDPAEEDVTDREAKIVYRWFMP